MTKNHSHSDPLEELLSLKCMQLTEEPLFELRGKDGHVWKLYENGVCEGFPEGTLILNKTLGVLGTLRGQIIELYAARSTDKQT